MSFDYNLPLDYSISGVLPAITLDFGLDYAIVKGATMLVKIGDELVEKRVWIKRGGILVDAGY